MRHKTQITTISHGFRRGGASDFAAEGEFGDRVVVPVSGWKAHGDGSSESA